MGEQYVYHVRGAVIKERVKIILDTTCFIVKGDVSFIYTSKKPLLGTILFFDELLNVIEHKAEEEVFD